MPWISTRGRNSMDSPFIGIGPLLCPVALTAARHIFNFSCRPQAVPMQQVLKRLQQHPHPDLTRGSDYPGMILRKDGLMFSFLILILIYVHGVYVTIKSKREASL